jgi:DNA-binding CsgD family transcriptional regulator
MCCAVVDVLGACAARGFTRPGGIRVAVVAGSAPEARLRAGAGVCTMGALVTGEWDAMRMRDAALIRKLCSLGLPPRALVQSLLPAVRELVPAHSGGVFWVDARGHMSALYAERMLPPEAMAAYYERHYEARGEGFAEAFRRRAAAPDRVSSHAFSAQEQASAYFRDVLHPLDAYHVLYGILDDAGRPFAQLSLYRGAAGPAFSAADAATLRSLLRYLAVGLAHPERGGPAGEDCVTVEEAVGVVARDGSVISASEDWRRLVRLAAVAEVAPSRASSEGEAIEDFLRAGAQDAGEREFVRSTAWGRFVVRRFALADPRGRRAEQVALLVRREEPRTLSLVRGSGHSDLSPQQREVALLLARGLTNAEIARTLGLSLNTASYHVKQVYLRLEVNDRDAVQGQLLRRAHGSVAA